jgi:hypothetical protein
MEGLTFRPEINKNTELILHKKVHFINFHRLTNNPIQK